MVPAVEEAVVAEPAVIKTVVMEVAVMKEAAMVERDEIQRRFSRGERLISDLRRGRGGDCGRCKRECADHSQYELVQGHLRVTAA